ncbi:hypothetical protein [Pseudooceanicola sp. MF1-13]|uniref:hypothetical protein n=1 Tax=Pseudooceanicola sp. MF1-13 TaxID=3379095 RepID=UPI003891F477
MKKTFQVNNILIALLGLPTMAVFIYEDSLGLFEKLPQWVANLAWLLVAIAIILSVWQLCTLLIDRSVTVCKGEISINKKMLSIINEPGNTCIVSRNLSWASGKIIMESLNKKAQSGDLTVLVSEENGTSETLKGRGAKILVYGGVIPKCRFTIKGHKGANSRLYIAKADSADRHVIFRHSEKDDVTLRLAEDLVHILEAKA